MARSIYDSERRLAGMAVEQYRQLKDSQARLQWGFKVMSQELERKVAAVAHQLMAEPFKYARRARAARRDCQGQ